MRALIEAGKDAGLAAFAESGDDVVLRGDAAFSIPTPEHYLPLLYVCALRRPGEAVTFPVEGYTGGSISMTSVCFG